MSMNNENIDKIESKESAKSTDKATISLKYYEQLLEASKKVEKLETQNTLYQKVILGLIGVAIVFGLAFSVVASKYM
jgi:hypothetical protein